jgi:Site-specific recombinase XerD
VVPGERLRQSGATQIAEWVEELRTLKRYLKVRGNSQLPWLFLTERGDQFTRFAINYLVRTAGLRAGLPFPVHLHMRGLRRP